MVVVVRGIGQVAISKYVVGINDPAPANVGALTWKDFQWLIAFVTRYPVDFNFLHLPFNEVFFERRKH